MQHYYGHLPSPGWRSLFNHAQTANKHMSVEIPVIDAISSKYSFPSRMTSRMTASPHAQASFAVSQAAGYNGHFCSTACCSRPERGCQAARPGLCGSSQAPEPQGFRVRTEVHTSKGKESVKPGPVGAYSYVEQ